MFKFIKDVFKALYSYAYDRYHGTKIEELLTDYIERERQLNIELEHLRRVAFINAMPTHVYKVEQDLLYLKYDIPNPRKTKPGQIIRLNKK